MLRIEASGSTMQDLKMTTTVGIFIAVMVLLYRTRFKSNCFPTRDIYTYEGKSMIHCLLKSGCRPAD